MCEVVCVMEALTLIALVAFVVLFWLETRETARSIMAPPPALVASPLAQVLAMPRRPSAVHRKPIPDSQNHRPG